MDRTKLYDDSLLNTPKLNFPIKSAELRVALGLNLPDLKDYKDEFNINFKRNGVNSEVNEFQYTFFKFVKLAKNYINALLEYSLLTEEFYINNIVISLMRKLVEEGYIDLRNEKVSEELTPEIFYGTIDSFFESLSPKEA